MTAVHPSRQPTSRLRSSSDPFVDPSSPTRLSSRPPPPPPKSAQKSSRMPSAIPKSAPAIRDQQRDIAEAVRDTVTVRGVTDYSPRTKMGRSQTQMPSPATTTRHAPPPTRRSHSQDSVIAAAAAVEKAKASNKKGSKKGSQHADVIDRLDFTGVGPMFHHDGPFDACAPSRNRHRTKAPMLAWSSRPEETPQYNDNPYPSASAYTAFSNSNSDYEPPKKKVDAIAEAWGIHEPEPYEEFFAGGGRAGDTPSSSIYNGKDSHNSSNSTSRSGAPKRTKDGRDAREVYNQYLDEGQSPRARGAGRRTALPPPQPIFVPDANSDAIGGDAPGSPGSPGGAPKRSKSLMHRIRKMRDAPNVPVGAGYDESGPPSPPSPSSDHANSYPPVLAGTRPTHRSQNSFLGRFGGGARGNQVSPTTEEPFVFIEDSRSHGHTRSHTINKDLPATPPSPEHSNSNGQNAGYFEDQQGGAMSPGLGRKTSLMKKMRTAVRGAK